MGVSNPVIEELVLEEAYLSLLSFDYQQPQALGKLKHLLGDICEAIWPERLVKERVKKLLCGLITGNREVIATCRELAHLNRSGHPWIPLAYVGLDSMLDAVPSPETYHLWNQRALSEKLAEFEPMIADAGVQAEEIARQFLAENYEEPCRG